MKMEKLKGKISNKAIGIFIAYKRVQLGMTIESVSEKSGLNRATLQRVENGTFNSSLPTHLKISRALGFSLEEMANFEELLLNSLEAPQ